MCPTAKNPYPGKAAALFACLLLLQFCLWGCSSSAFLPSAKNTVRSPWNSFDEVKTAFDKIKPYETDRAKLRELGFAPDSSPNVQILNHLDILQRFLPNQSITLEDLDEGLQDCLAAQDHCQAYEILVRHTDAERYGNVLLDLLNFHRRTSLTGWEFKAIVVMKDDLTVYKLCSGKPKINEFQDSRNPLGPLQNTEKVIWGVAQ